MEYNSKTSSNSLEYLEQLDKFGDSFIENINKNDLIKTFAKMEKKDIQKYKKINDFNIDILKEKINKKFNKNFYMFNSNIKIMLNNLDYNEIDKKYLIIILKLLNIKNEVNISNDFIKIKIDKNKKFKILKLNKILNIFKKYLNDK